MKKLVGPLAVRLSMLPAVQAVLGGARRLARMRHTRALRSFGELQSFERKVLSQNGEDGILRELLFRLGRDRFFVEFGVQDGSECNTALLSQWYGWNGVLIEGDPAYAARLRERYRDGGVTVLCEFVTRENIVQLFERAGVPQEFDLLSIDIDGNDYWVWEALGGYRPRVVVIEYNGSIPPDRFWIMRYDPAHRWNKTLYYGASLSALKFLGDRKGYALVGTDSAGVNAFFVRRDLLAAAGFPERTVAEAYSKPGGFSTLFPAHDGPAVTDPAQLG
ncbi:MAG: hypothetical protein JO359_00820 [Candidatus Eremiobacteraeota bacterium]|nr:hypothetical protein [Candidatus Eremiobacteraeota bacterium]